MFRYNLAFIVLLIIGLPYVLIKLITQKRFRYHFWDRIWPKPIKVDDYILVHLASLGEAKAFLNVKDTVEDLFKKKIIFSVTSNIGYEYLHSQGFTVLLAPIDFYTLYNRLFCYKLPYLAIFFETEIWPSYINFLRKNDIKVFLINARMSQKSYKFYKAFKSFSYTISQFNMIIAKSEVDRQRFITFNPNVKVCENIKYALKRKEFKSSYLKALKSDKKNIFVFASFHKQELKFLNNAIRDVLSLGYRVIIAPRYLEDLQLFENLLALLDIDYAYLSQNIIKDCVLVDSFGMLESIYSISDIVFVGGSLNSELKGHNPIEPAIYGNFVLCGLYMDSFAQEVEYLKNLGCLFQIDDINKLKGYVLKCQTLPVCDLERKKQDIINCYKKVFSEFFIQA